MPRPTIAEIDLNALRFNLKQIRQLVGQDVKICPAVKADGYGHGAVPVSRALLDAGADMLGVATLEEAAELREAGISVPILMLQCILDEQVAEVLASDTTVAVCTESSARALSIEAQKSGKKAKVHIKIDTGMGRIGVQEDQAVELAKKIAAMPGLEIEGAFTHFPSADEDDLEFTRQQLGRFVAVTQAIEAAGIPLPLKHAANSAAILRLPEAH
ncbi:MAG TPA: alanine racemase, partial [Armatimonadota bacterium]